MDQIPINSYPDEVARMWKAQRDIAIEALERCTNAHLRDGRFIDVAEDALTKIKNLETK